jgi:WD40 repeat protein
VTALSYSADGKVLASSGGPDDNEVRLWDMTTNSLKRGVLFSRSGALSPDGKYLAYSGTDSGKSGLGVFLVNGSTTSTIITPSADTKYESIRFSPDGNFIYYVQFDGKTSSYTPYKIPILGGAPTKIQTPSRGVGAIFSPDLKSVAVAIGNSFVISDTEDGSVKYILSGYSGSLTSSAFSPDGKTFAGGGGYDICIWEISKEDPKQMLKGHTSNVRTIVFSPDGKLIASGSFDKTIKIWDAASGSLLQTLTGHEGIITSLVFSPDGKTIASGSEDKTIKLWRVK